MHVPIVHLMNALVALQDNSVSQIVKPTRRRGRSPSTNKQAALKGHVAATVKRLQEVWPNREMNEVHRAVAQKLSRLGVRAERGSGHITADTVRNWCNEVSNDFSRHGTAAIMYDSLLTETERKRFAALPEETAANFALRSLTDWILRSFPALKKN